MAAGRANGKRALPSWEGLGVGSSACAWAALSLVVRASSCIDSGRNEKLRLVLKLATG